MASPLLTPELEYRDYKKEDDESCKALEMRAMQGKTNIHKSPLWLVMHTCGRCGELHRLYFHVFSVVSIYASVHLLMENFYGWQCRGISTQLRLPLPQHKGVESRCSH
jgi:hypothetical protein